MRSKIEIVFNNIFNLYIYDDSAVVLLGSRLHEDKTGRWRRKGIAASSVRLMPILIVRIMIIMMSLLDDGNGRILFLSH